jgi:hypothetical protein
VLALVLSSLTLTAILLAAAVPVSVFFLMTGANYYFLTLLHVAIVLGAGLVGMLTLHEGLAFACEQRGVYPRKAMAIMKAWAVLFAFVGHPDGVEPAAVRRRSRRAVQGIPAARGELLHRHRLLVRPAPAAASRSRRPTRPGMSTCAA